MDNEQLILDELRKLNKTISSIDFWLGALSSHSLKRLQMECQERGIEVVWHDPTVEPWPFDGGHGEVVPPITKMRIGIPREHRKGSK